MAFEKQCIGENISPGGSADFIGTSYIFDRV